ncbi:MAG: cytochrome c1, partial [Kangiellaceae bacterium]
MKLLNNKNIINKMIKKTVTLALVGFSVNLMAAGGGSHIPNDDMPNYSGDRLIVSMQKGMQIYMNNCMGCHGLAFQRYNRSAKDLKISDAMMIDNLMFTADKIGDPMANNMQAEAAEKWFGTAPPDLSLIARSRSTHWLYNYLRAFYQDDSRPYGVNNSVFADVGMPHALENMQGIQDKTEEVKGIENDIGYAQGEIATAREALNAKKGSASSHQEAISKAEHLILEKELELIELSKSGKYFTMMKQGRLTPEEFDVAMADLVNFLDYVGEPVKLERKSMGVYVLMFI